ncbi:MAG: hypothetical protein IJ174_04240 [Clostridia bacterium]|nr:hypothetical protein [Clostridia bacterium]
MTNKEIYQKTLTFSVRRLLFDLGGFLLLGILAVGGFYLMEKLNDKGLVGLGIGIVIGIIVLIVLFRYVSYTYKAGQIAMMTKAVTEGGLPQDVLGEGKAIVKARFTTVAIFFAVTRAIKAIFNQLARGLNAVGRAVGGDSGGSVADVISSAISVVVGYLCDCCLGWIFYRKDQNAAKAACEGAVLFFKHGKTLLKNLGRVFGLGLLSLLVIGGVFFGIFYAIFSAFPAGFATLAQEIAKNASTSESGVVTAMGDPHTLMLIAAGLAAVILWGILHSTFVRPFVLVGVLRNYMESGMNDIPTEESFNMLDSKSARFRKLHAEGI